MSQSRDADVAFQRGVDLQEAGRFKEAIKAYDAKRSSLVQVTPSRITTAALFMVRSSSTSERFQTSPGNSAQSKLP